MSTICDIYRNAISLGHYNADEMTNKIETMYASDRITAEERVELLRLCNDHADDRYQIDVIAKLADLESRIAVLESAGVCVWKSGMSTAKGQTVLYDILGDGVMRYCRYDGGRAATSLRPGKIDGWVVLASAGGAVTHKIGWDENGKNILIPVEAEA